jgi:phage terminase Nu1 subunit (DNA packaging protein)
MAKQPEPHLSIQIGGSSLAKMLELTDRRIRDLSQRGVLNRIGRGQYNLAESVTAYIRHLRNDSRTTGGDTTQIQPSADLEAMIEAVKNARDYNDARTLKTKIDALRSAHALAADQARYMPVDDICEQFAHITSILRGGLLAMAGELPPHLEGLTAPEIERQLDAYVDRLLSEWHEGFRPPEQQQAPPKDDDSP